MATSGYSDAWVTSWDTLRFNWWQIEQSIAGNYTKIGWNIELISGSSGAIYSTAAKSWTAMVNGAYYEGANTVNIGNNTNKYLASGETIIYHDADGSKQFSYSFNQYFGITFSGSWIGTVSGSGSAWLEPIPRQAIIRSAPDFTDKDSPTIRFDNPAGSAVTVQVCISWTGAPDIAYRTVDPGATSYTFNFTEAELNALYAATLNGSNSRYVTFHVTTIIGSNVYYSPLQRLFTVTDCLPELNPTVEDLGGSSVPVTGNSSILLRYFNYPKATFNAAAKKGASIVSRTVTCGSQTLKAEGDYAQFNNVDSGTFIFTIKDNRGNEVSKPVTLTMIDYITLSCGTIIDKDLNPDNTANITLNITGDYYKGSLGFYDNDLTVEYRYKSNTTDYPLDADGNEKWNTAEYTVSNGKYEAVATIKIIDYKDTYTIQTRAKDMLYTWGVAAKDEIVKIVPVFDWGENDFNFNVPIFKEGHPVGYYPVGGIFTSAENIDPGELFGGTWQLMRTFYGGELVAYGTAWNSTSMDKEYIHDTYYGMSDILGGIYTDSLHNYIPDILIGSSGTIWVQTKGIVGLVEANVEISGCTANSGCYGIWFIQNNKNTLPTGVTLNGGGTLHAINGYYSGNSTRYFYNINDDDSGTDFFINPQWTPYGGTFRPCHSGTRSILQVKAFAKGGTNYMWKRIA